MGKKIEQYSMKDTIVVHEHSKERIDKIRELSEKLKVKIWWAKCYQDILAVPSFLCIVNPQDISAKDWKELVSNVEELDDPNMKIYLTGEQRKPSLPAKFVVKPPAKESEDFLKFLLIKTRAKIERKKQNSDKAIRKITRLMFILRELDNGYPVKISKIAEKLEVAVRTIQRDIEILETAGYPLIQEKRGEFCLPKKFRSYDLFYND